MTVFFSYVAWISNHYCFHHRSLRSIQTHWSALHTWLAPVEECGWHSPRARPFVSFILKHWSSCRKSTSQRAQRCWTPVHTHHATLCCLFPFTEAKLLRLYHFIWISHTFIFIILKKKMRVHQFKTELSSPESYSCLVRVAPWVLHSRDGPE